MAEKKATRTHNVETYDRTGFKMGRNQMKMKLAMMAAVRIGELAGTLIASAPAGTVRDIDKASQGDPDVAFRLLWPSAK